MSVPTSAITFDALTLPPSPATNNRAVTLTGAQLQQSNSLMSLNFLAPLPTQSFGPTPFVQPFMAYNGTGLVFLQQQGHAMIFNLRPVDWTMGSHAGQQPSFIMTGGGENIPGFIDTSKISAWGMEGSDPPLTRSDPQPTQSAPEPATLIQWGVLLGLSAAVTAWRKRRRAPAAA